MSVPAPVRVGLVGAGPWASGFHAPLLAAGPQTELVGVWARRREAAEQLAADHGTEAAASLDALFERCEAIAFAVPPQVQAELAPRAADAGKHLLLEKPLALSIDAARAVVAAAQTAGVVTQLVLPLRYRAGLRDFAAAAQGFPIMAAQLSLLSGVLAGDGPFATPWRRAEGALADLGPHLFDALELIAGPIVGLRGHGDPLKFVALTTQHESGAVASAQLSLALPHEDGGLRCRLYGPHGRLELSPPSDPAQAQAESAAGAHALLAEFAANVRLGRSERIGAAHGLHLQELLGRARRCLAE